MDKPIWGPVLESSGVLVGSGRLVGREFADNEIWCKKQKQLQKEWVCTKTQAIAMAAEGGWMPTPPPAPRPLPPVGADKGDT